MVKNTGIVVTRGDGAFPSVVRCPARRKRRRHPDGVTPYSGLAGRRRWLPHRVPLHLGTGRGASFSGSVSSASARLPAIQAPKGRDRERRSLDRTSRPLVSIERRRFMAALAVGLLAAPLAAEAQQAPKIARIGYLGGVSAVPQIHEAFLQGLQDIGYVVGRNVVIEYRDPEGKYERLPALAAELVALKVD